MAGDAGEAFATGNALTSAEMQSSKIKAMRENFLVFNCFFPQAVIVANIFNLS